MFARYKILSKRSRRRVAVAIVNSLAEEQINEVVVSVIPIPEDGSLNKAYYGFCSKNDSCETVIYNVLRDNQYDEADLDVVLIERF